MLSKKNPTSTNSWKELQSHYQELKNIRISDLFLENPRRFSEFSIRENHFLLDFSKNIITSQTLNLLLNFCNEMELSNAIKSLFGGDYINETENRQVMHFALRNTSHFNFGYPNSSQINQQVDEVLHRMGEFVDKIHSGEWRGFSGKKIKYFVNIGIGGSDLGSAMVCEALKPYWIEGLKVFFVSNVDGSHLWETLKQINPEETLFIVSSKTFTTQETMANAQSAKKWLTDFYADDNCIENHFAAVSTNYIEVEKFGIPSKQRFEFWDWVGGRYSLTSAIGLPIMCILGKDKFHHLLEGFHEMDKHFYSTSFEKNIPVIMGIIGVWYTNFFNAHSEAIIPYDQYLARFSAHFQQVNMESNGKSVDRNGNSASYPTGPIIWGEPGTNGQHAFFQLIHQGTHFIPCDFIAALKPHHPLSSHHDILMANFFAQTEALMNGKKDENLSPHRQFEGNKPTNTILLDELNPFTLGYLIAAYEHKIFVQGVLWNIYSFDQWGVELGKQLAQIIYTDIQSEKTLHVHDSSTIALIEEYKKSKM
jgi:glucose-6-phosphate isomerase